MTEKKEKIKYIISDFVGALLAWTLFFIFRKVAVDKVPLTPSSLLDDPHFWTGIGILPLAWCLLYAFLGTYRNVRRKARLKELQTTFWTSLAGVIVIFFALLLDDNITGYRSYYSSFLVLFLLHFSLTYLGRLILTTRNARQIHSRKAGFATLMVGGGDKALQTYRDLDRQAVYSGNIFLGFVSQRTDSALSSIMPRLGTLCDIDNILATNQLEEVIIAVDDTDAPLVKELILQLVCRGDLIVKIVPELNDILYGSVKADSIFHSPLITITPRLMEQWQYSVKRLADIVISLLALIILSPLFLITALIVRLTSPGPVFYAQERIGFHGKPFMMHKFRSMYVDAERQGPALSSDDDPRITPFGRIMRKYRLDEIPQFYNVLRGTMSLVGPRPERQHFIDQIVRIAPEYRMLHRVKPGITSWGQVKYGYAENVDQMVQRLRYDLLYLENMSLTTDIKILLYTVLIILQGRGK